MFLLLSQCLANDLLLARLMVMHCWSDMEPFTDAVIKFVNNLDIDLWFVLLVLMRKKKFLIKNPQHNYRISPQVTLFCLQRILGFKAFFQGNAFLKKQDKSQSIGLDKRICLS